MCSKSGTQNDIIKGIYTKEVVYSPLILYSSIGSGVQVVLLVHLALIMIMISD